MANEYKVRYLDAREQIINADEWEPRQDEHVFFVGGEKIAAIAKNRVESVMRADMPDPVARTPRTGAV